MGRVPQQLLPQGSISQGSVSREAPSQAEPGQGAHCSPHCWHWQVHVPCPRWGPRSHWPSFPQPAEQGKLGVYHLAPGATELQLCFESFNTLHVLCQQFAAAGGDGSQLGRAPGKPSCFPPIRGEQTGGCRRCSQAQAEVRESCREEKLEGGCRAQSG